MSKKYNNTMGKIIFHNLTNKQFYKLEKKLIEDYVKNRKHNPYKPLKSIDWFNDLPQK